MKFGFYCSLLLLCFVFVPFAEQANARDRGLSDGVWQSRKELEKDGKILRIEKFGNYGVFEAKSLGAKPLVCTGTIDFRIGSEPTASFVGLLNPESRSRSGCPETFRFGFEAQESDERVNFSISSERMNMEGWFERIKGPPAENIAIQWPKGVDILGIKPGTLREDVETLLDEKISFVQKLEQKGYGAIGLEGEYAALISGNLKRVSNSQVADPPFTLVAYAERQWNFRRGDNYDNTKFKSISVVYHQNRVVSITRRFRTDPNSFDALNSILNEKYNVDQDGNPSKSQSNFLNNDETVLTYLPSGQPLAKNQRFGFGGVGAPNCLARPERSFVQGIREDNDDPAFWFPVTSGCTGEVIIRHSAHNAEAIITLSEGIRHDSAVWPHAVLGIEPVLSKQWRELVRTTPVDTPEL